jgi:hypothetical protein
VARGFELELEAVADAVAGVDQDGDAQGQIAFRVELLDIAAVSCSPRR